MLNQLAPEQSSASALLRLEDVSRVFDIRRGLFGEKRSLVAVDGVSLSLAKGASLGLVGESGCLMVAPCPLPGRTVGPPGASR